MPKINCDLKYCGWNKDNVCQAKEIEIQGYQSSDEGCRTWDTVYYETECITSTTTSEYSDGRGSVVEEEDDKIKKTAVSEFYEKAKEEFLRELSEEKYCGYCGDKIEDFSASKEYCHDCNRIINSD